MFEGYVASELVKAQTASGRPREIYYFRDQQGLEVDFIIPRGSARLALVECKASKTVRPSDAAPLRRLLGAVSHRALSPKPRRASRPAVGPGVPVRIKSPGSSVTKRPTLADDLLDAGDQVARPPRLARLAVHESSKKQVAVLQSLHRLAVPIGPKGVHALARSH